MSGEDAYWEERLALLHGVVAAGGPPVSLRPVLDLRSSRLLAVEAVAQFPDDPEPGRWLADARQLGVTLELELGVIAAALAAVKQALPVLPEGARLWVEASSATVRAAQLGQLLARAAVPVTVLVSEDEVVAGHPGLPAAAADLRRAGIGIAVTGVSAGYAGLRNILRLDPDVLKLDPSLTFELHRDLARAELTRAVVRIAHHLGAAVVAGGIAEQVQVQALLAVGITAGQGPGLVDAMPAPPVPGTSPEPAAGGEVGDHGPRDLESLTRPILELIIRLTGLETAYLTVLDPDEMWLEHRFVLNTGVLEVPEGLTIPWIDSLCKRCRDAGLLWTDDVSRDLPPIPLGRDAPIQTFVSVPVTLPDGRVAGTLCAMGSTARRLDGEMEAELAFFARLLADRYGREFGGDSGAANPPAVFSHHLAAGDVPAESRSPH